MRALGIDLGERRIGVALSSGSVASPIETGKWIKLFSIYITILYFIAILYLNYHTKFSFIFSFININFFTI